MLNKLKYFAVVAVTSTTVIYTPMNLYYRSNNSKIITNTYNTDITNETVNDIQITIKNEKVIGDKSNIKNNNKITKDEDLDPPETIFDLYSKEDRFILYRIVEAECTGLSKECKMNVANVIINRVNNDEFPNTISEVVFQKVNGISQFSPISDKRYYSVDITDETKEACADIFTQEDTTNGSLYFDCCSSSWASRNREYKMEDDGHKFYK